MSLRSAQVIEPSTDTGAHLTEEQRASVNEALTQQ